MKKNSNVMISYLPLVYSNPGFDYTTEDMIESVISLIEESLKVSGADACMWVQIKGVISPVFVMEKGDEIFDHLMWWSEDDPTGAFTLEVSVNKETNSYVICLPPDINRSMGRFKKNMETLNLEIPKDGFGTFIFNDIHFYSRCPKNDAVNIFLKQSESDLYIVDSKYMNSDPSSMMKYIKKVGRFSIVVDGMISSGRLQKYDSGPDPESN